MRDSQSTWRAKARRQAYQSPAETTVAAQVQMLDELITQKVASITISTNGDAGYDEVFKRAQDAGIPIVSVDSEANPEYRICHVNQAEVQAIGSYLVQAGVLITLGIDYPGDGKMEETLWRQSFRTTPAMRSNSASFPHPSTHRYRTPGSMR